MIAPRPKIPAPAENATALPWTVARTTAAGAVAWLVRKLAAPAEAD